MVVARVFSIEVALAGERQGVALDGDVDLFPAQAGQFRTDDDLRVGLVDVAGRSPRRGPRALFGERSEVPEQVVGFLGQTGSEQAEWVCPCHAAVVSGRSRCGSGRHNSLHLLSLPQAQSKPYTGKSSDAPHASA